MVWIFAHLAIAATQIGAITSAPVVSGNTVLFKCANAQVQVKFCGQDIVKVWCDEDSVFKRTDPGWFSTKSFAVETEDLGGPSIVTVANKGSYYEIITDNLLLRVQANPFGISFYDKAGVLLSSDYASSTTIKCRWIDKGIMFLADDGTKVTYGTDSTGDAAQWIFSYRNDSCTIMNKATGHYMNIENGRDYVECSAMQTMAPSAWWVRENADPYCRIRNTTTPNKYIQTENTKGYAQCDTVQTTWYSAQWSISGADGFSWDKSTGEKSCRKQMQNGENFFGLGQSRKGFNKTGISIINWNRDLLGTGQPWDLGVDTAGNYYTSQPFVISTKGYGLFFDNTSRTKFDLGKDNPGSWYFGTLSPAAAGQMIYYFIFGPDMKKVVTRFTDLTGKTFFPPRWALGHMQSHWGYKQSDIESISSTYRQKNIPCDAMIADIDWYACQCAPVGWNGSNFANGPGLIANLHNNGFKFLRIDDPNVSDNQGACTQAFSIGNSNNYFVRNAQNQPSKVIWPWGGSSGLVDFFNTDASHWWSSLQQPRMAEGLDGMWCDMNEPALSNTDMQFYSSSNTSLGGLAELHNVYGLAHVRSNFNGMRAYFDSTSRNHNRTFILCRSGYSGQQKYSLNWSGDISRNWDWLASQVYQGMSEGLCGYALWAHDVGGFTGAIATEELEARWFEFGALSPVSRIHYSNGDHAQEPWQYGSSAEAIARKYIQMRYRLKPYLYTELAQSIVFKTGLPLMRPLVLEYPTDTKTYDLNDEYLIGSSMLIAPVVTGGATTRSVYLPAGIWIDYWDGTTQTGPTTIASYSAPLDKVPIFIKAGTILPQYPLMNFDGEKPADTLTLDVFPNQSTSYSLYEDDGVTTAYQQGNYSTTDISSIGNADGGGVQINVAAAKGTFSGKLSTRAYNFVVHYSKKPDSVCINQKPLSLVSDTVALANITAGWCYVAGDRKGTVRIKTAKIQAAEAFVVTLDRAITGTILTSQNMKAFSSVGIAYVNKQIIATFGTTFSGSISVAVYGINGKCISRGRKTIKTGSRIVVWNGENSWGKAVARGQYLVELTYGNARLLKKCIIN